MEPFSRILLLLVLMIALTSLVLVDLRVRRMPDSMRVSVLDLSQPVKPHPPVESRAQLAWFLTAALHASNPLGLQASSRQTMRDNARELVRTAKQLMWLQCRLLEGLPASVGDSFSQYVRQPDPRVNAMQYHWDDALRVAAAAFPPRAGGDYKESMPDGWTLSQERADLQIGWKHAFDDAPAGFYVVLEGASKSFVMWLAQQQSRRQLDRTSPDTGPIIVRMAAAAQKLTQCWSGLQSGANSLSQAVPDAPRPGEDMPFTNFLEAVEKSL